MAVSRVVIVGASVAGIRAAQALRSGGFDGEVVVAGAEDVIPYDKPPLSKQLITGESTADDIGLLRDDPDFDLRLGRTATRLNPARHLVTLSDGERLGYDALIIATGVRARTLPGPAGDLVTTVRELRDSTALRARVTAGEPVVVIGGGFIGAEVAAAARTSGCEVTIVEQDPAPFSRVLGAATGRLVTALHEAHGVAVLGGATVTAVEPVPSGGALVRLADGRSLPAGTVVAGIGCVPNTDWLAGSGLPVEDGVLTDEHCAVRGSAARADGAGTIYAIGDVARWHDAAGGVSRRVEHWTNAVEQASLVAHQILHPGQPRPYASVPYFWSDQYDRRIQMVGRAAHGDTVEVLRCATSAGDREVALYSRAGRFAAAVTFGWPKASVAARQAWQRGADAAEVRAAIAKLSGGVTPVDLTTGGAAAAAGEVALCAGTSNQGPPVTTANGNEAAGDTPATSIASTTSVAARKAVKDERDG
jgi:phthalate 3,4-dioxygenase ferredoxin reductase subunit